MIWSSVVLGGLLAAAALWWLRRRLLVVTLHGESMAPTYHDGDQVLVRRYLVGGPRVGQVVVADLAATGVSASSPVDGTSLGPGRAGAAWASRVVKRVAAVAGGSAPAELDDGRPTVPSGKLVLLGDNSSVSYDSRHYGYVPVERVVGIVVRRLRYDLTDDRRAVVPRFCISGSGRTFSSSL